MSQIKLTNADIAVFDNPSFVDSGGSSSSESDNVQAAFAGLGHNVTTFIATDAAGINTAIAGKDVIAFPEFEIGTYLPNPAASQAISDYVAGGGTLIKFGFSGNNGAFLNTVFGFSVSETSAGFVSLQQAATTGTPFEDDAVNLSSNNGTEGLTVASLPVGAEAFYVSGSVATVAWIQFGAGQIFYLGWDWFNGAPVGSQDNGWLNVLDSSVSRLGDLGTPGDDNLTGTPGDDIINALAGDDVVAGEAGNDLLIGGPGADALDGGPGSDTASFFSATAGVTASLADPSANTGDASGDTYTNIENLSGSNFNDILIGDAGDNELTGRAGDDTLDGGAGNDTAVFQSLGVSVDLTLTGPQDTGDGVDTLINIENLATSGGNDSLTGDANANRLDAGAGDDSLTGGDGDDTLIGGIGDDILAGGLGNDTIIGGDDIDTALFGDANVVVDLANSGAQDTGEGLDLITGVENLRSGAGDDQLAGDDRANILDGGDGNDSLLGYSGDDTLIGGSGSDILNGQLGNDAMQGGTGNDFYVVNSNFDRVLEEAGEGTDTIRASITYSLNAKSVHLENLVLGGTAPIDGFGNDIDNIVTGNNNANSLEGGLGDDILNGLGGMDVLKGGAGNDRLNGASGNDLLFGGLGDDYFIVDRTTDLVIEYPGEGYDTVVSSAPFYSLNHHSQAIEAIRLAGSGNIEAVGNQADNLIGGQAGDNRLSGGLGNDTIFGNAGDDFLNGGAGADYLLGGIGDDILNGGFDSDRDTFIFEDNFGQDIIQAFDNVNEDVINLARVTNIMDFADLQTNHLTQVGADTVIADGANTITILNTASSTLDITDFAF